MAKSLCGGKLRATRHPAKGKRGRFVRVACGCGGTLDIYPRGRRDDLVEIGGVLAPASEWRRVLGPVLRG